MTDIAREFIRTWLRDAHAMEEQAEQLFTGYAKRMMGYPEVHKKLLLEASYAKDHQEMLSIRLQQLGSSSSIIKDECAKLLAGIQNFFGSSMNDESVKSILALHTFTQMSIGSYQILIAAVLKVDDTETFRVCKAILTQVQVRALWIEDQLSAVTQTLISEISQAPQGDLN